MNHIDRKQVAQSFSAAADYDRHARVQRLAARRLAGRIAELRLPKSPRILEIGCGTGLLTEALIELDLGGDWLITDLSRAMLDRCHRRIGNGEGRRFAVLDAEYGDPGERFDLVCSSLAVQWFDDQPAAFSRMQGWLLPGGHSIHTTLGAGSFVEWRSAHAIEGLEAGTLNFMPAEDLSPATIDRHVERHGDAMDFMRSLKAIGAHTAPRAHRPLPPVQLRRVMRNFEAGGSAISYEVVTCHRQNT